MAAAEEGRDTLPGSVSSRRVPAPMAKSSGDSDRRAAVATHCLQGTDAGGTTEGDEGSGSRVRGDRAQHGSVAEITSFLSARLDLDAIEGDDEPVASQAPTGWTSGGRGGPRGRGRGGRARWHRAARAHAATRALGGRRGRGPISGRDFASGKLDLTVPHTEPPRFVSAPQVAVQDHPTTPPSPSADALGPSNLKKGASEVFPLDAHGRRIVPGMTVNRSISEGPEALLALGAAEAPEAEPEMPRPRGSVGSVDKRSLQEATAAKRGSGSPLRRFSTFLTTSLLPSKESKEPMTLTEAADASADDPPLLALVRPGTSRAMRGRTDSCLSRMRRSPVAMAIRKVVGHPAWVTLVLATSVWAICADDLHILLGTADSNEAWMATMWATLAFFGCELCLYSVLVEGYAFSFFFWLDLVATLAIMPAASMPDSLLFARVARASRALRVVRVMRASRLASVVGAGIGRGCSTWYEHHSRARASIMGRSLVYHTHLSITTGTVALLLGTALLSGEHNVAETARHGLCFLHMAAPALGVPALGAAGVGANWTQVVDGYRQAVSGFARMGRDTDVAQAAGGNKAELVRLSVRGVLIQDWSTGALDLRTDNPVEVVAFSCGGAPLQASEWLRDAAPEPSPSVSVAHVSLRESVLAEAEDNLWNAAYILLILSLWMLGFSYDFSRLVVIPLERMVSFLKLMMDDPLHPLDLDERRLADIRKVQSYEMQVVEINLAKMSRLLQLGFGDAGARIIARNLVLGEVDPMAPGHKVLAVMGFCDIRSFTDMTEVLREQVLEFTNTVAEIVGTAVHNRGGGVNKNIGDAFFAVWRVRDRHRDSMSHSEEGWGKGLEADKDVGAECDAALQAFLVSNRQVLEAEAVQAYGRHPGIQARLPGYEVRLGFGLHVGWAIEGAVGNRFKIDATYLSPHVNLTSRLESLTKSYGVTLLMSGQFTKRLSEGVRVYVRPVDRVTVKGSAMPVLLETWDQETASDMRPIAESGEFLRKWNLAFCTYLQGRWGEARAHMDACLELRPADKVAQAILEFMGRSSFVAPADWEGYRTLVEK